MNSVKALREHVDANRLELIQIVSVPRSMSTALGRALAQSATGDSRVFVNEPFPQGTGTNDKGFDALLEVLEPRLAATEGKLTVVTKNMAAFLPREAFRELSALAIGNIFTIRNPRLQIVSLLVRGINDSQKGPGADKISQAEIPAYLPRLSEVYSSGPDFRMGWEAILEHYHSTGNDHTVVIDGDRFACSPKSVLQSTCSVLELPYHDGMVDGWAPGDYVNIGGSGGSSQPANNAWTRNATISTGVFSGKAREPLDLRRAPAELREYIGKIAMPAYESRLVEPVL